MSNSVITPMFQPEIETMSREEIRALQLAKLKDQVAWTYERVPWYREKMGELGVVPGDIQTLEDIRKLPFTDKSIPIRSASSPFRSMMWCACMLRRALRESRSWWGTTIMIWISGVIASPAWLRWQA